MIRGEDWRIRSHRSYEEHAPFCRISRCSHRMSPMKAGARARKDSFPMAQICFPVMCCHGCIATPSSENSPIAQCNQWATAASDHCLGSGRGKKRENKNKDRIVPQQLPRIPEGRPFIARGFAILAIRTDLFRRYRSEGKTNYRFISIKCVNGKRAVVV